ncbi:hypothetical protein WICPIJ_006857, partial [Wickerhamomyces pijperi]
ANTPSWRLYNLCSTLITLPFDPLPRTPRTVKNFLKYPWLINSTGIFSESVG